MHDVKGSDDLSWLRSTGNAGTDVALRARRSASARRRNLERGVEVSFRMMVESDVSAVRSDLHRILSSLEPFEQSHTEMPE